MKKSGVFFALTLLAVCFVITNSCSQTPKSTSSPVPLVFEASTPCDDISKKLLGIPASFKAEWIKWKLTLYHDPVKLTPLNYELVCMYGLPKQGTREFIEGASSIESKGKWTIGKGIKEDPQAVIYTLHPDNSAVSLSFLRPDQNLLHLLDEDNLLMIGNGAWSYTLNRINPVTDSSTRHFTNKDSQLHSSTDSATVGVFDARTPCNSLLRDLNGILASGCQLIKFRLTLYQDPATHTPTTFQLFTVYVGKGDTRYSNTGKWIVTKGTKNDPGSIVYQLQPNPDKPGETLSLLKAGDNILFFLDKNGNLMVGNDYASYTLNRTKK